MSREMCSGILAVGLAGCFPTVHLGRDDPAEGTVTEGADTLPAGTEPTTGDVEGTSTHADGAETTRGDGGGGGSGVTSEGGGGSTTGSVTGRIPGPCSEKVGSGCLTCAQSECCEELELCAGQPSCECFLSCLLGETPLQECQSICMPTSGVAAVIVCAQMSCAPDCNFSEGTGTEGGT